MIAEAGASPATVDASISWVMPSPWVSIRGGRDLAQLVGGRAIGIVAERLDAVGQTGVGQDQRDALHRAVEAALGECGADAVGVGFGTDELVDRLSVIIAQGAEHRGEIVIGHVGERTIEETEVLEAGLHLIHVVRRYRRAMKAPPQALRVR